MAPMPTNSRNGNGNGASHINVQPSPIRKEIERINSRTLDPSSDVAGMPPNYGQWVLPHIITAQGLFGTFSKVYRPSDEALQDSLDNARFMRNDPGIMECVEARQRCTALLKWQLIPEDEKSPEQQQLCAELTKIIERIPRFVEYRMNLLHAIWFGRYAIQHRFRHVNVGGKMRVLPSRSPTEPDDIGWLPVHGDKLVFRYDDGEKHSQINYQPFQVGIRIGARLRDQNRIANRWNVENIGLGRGAVQPTDRGLAYFLEPWERSLLSVHKHMIEDGEWEFPLAADKIHGVGIRSRIYWDWFQKQNALAYLMEYLERSAGGIEVHYFPAGNPEAELKARTAAEERIGNGRNIILMPRPVGEDAMAFGVEFIEPGMAGIDALKELLTDYFGHRIKRYILGQILTSEAEATGLGSGVADAHVDTMMQIIAYDAANLEETLTHELVTPLKRFNFPKAQNIHVRLVISTEGDDIQETMEAWSKAYEMGARLRERDVMELIGAAIPDPDDRVLERPDMQQQQDPGQGGGMFPGVGPGATQPAPPDAQTQRAMSEDMTTDVLNDLFGDPATAEGGKRLYVAENGKWVPREVPEFDTGDRHRVDKYKQSGERWITIGANGDKKGMPVRIDEDGHITAGGPQEWHGKKLTHAFGDQTADRQHATARSDWSKASRNDIKSAVLGGQRVPMRFIARHKGLDKEIVAARSGSTEDPDKTAAPTHPQSLPPPPVKRLPGATADLRGVHAGKHSPVVGATILDRNQIAADPKRFQYKISGIDPKTGVTKSLKDVKRFSPMLGGQLLVWRDPDNQKTYVVNGHHRLELAQRAPENEEWHGDMSVYYVDAKDAKQSRSLGALANIAEGHGTSTDAAKYLRDSGSSIDDLKEAGISVKGRVAEEGAILASLSDHIFQKLTNGLVTEGRALAIAKHLPDRYQQDELFREIDKAESKQKRTLPDSTVGEMARELAATPTVQEGAGGLFGDQLFQRSLIAERGTLKAFLRSKLGGEARTFKEASSERRQEALESVGQNVLDVDANKRRAKQAAVMTFDFGSYANAKGHPLAEAISKAAEELHDKPRDKKRIQSELLKRARGILSADTGGTPGSRRTTQGAPGPGGPTESIRGVTTGMLASPAEPYGRHASDTRDWVVARRLADEYQVSIDRLREAESQFAAAMAHVVN